MSSSFAMPELTLVLSRSATQQAAFNQYVQEQYDASSPLYHRWLTPTEIGQRFGPSQADIATISSWLTGHGLTVLSVAPDRMTIRFRGTAGQVEGALHTEIHRLSVNGVPHYANVTAPQIPAALAPVVVGVKALHDFLPHPLHKVGGIAHLNQQTGRWQRVVQAASAATGVSGGSSGTGTVKPELGGSARPMFGYVGSSQLLTEDVGPNDFATIYNVSPLWQKSINGSGETIAVAGTSLINANDVTSFRSVFGLPSGPPLKQIDTHAEGTTASQCTSTSSSAVCGYADLLENSLDVEWAGAIAPAAQVDLVVTGQPTGCDGTTGNGCIDTVYDSAQYVVQNAWTTGSSVNGVRILSVSYGQCELGNGTSSNVAYYNLWQSAAAEGISVFVATGDSGSPSCDQGGDAIGNPYSAQEGLTVSGLASTPYDTAVGGTDFAWCKPVYDSKGNFTGCPSNMSGAGPYWKTSNAGGGESAVNYIPENPWNDSCMNPIWVNYLNSVATLNSIAKPANAEATCNFVQKNYVSIYNQSVSQGSPFMLSPWIDTVGGSGGASSCVSNDYDTNPNNPTCTAGASSVTGWGGAISLTSDGWQKPAWQAGIAGIPGDGVRDLPDVSFFGGDGSLGSATLVCDSQYLQLTGQGTSCGLSGSSPAMVELGGTSVATPEMAGVMALINQSAGGPQGLAAPELYALAAKQNYANCSSESGSTGNGCYFNDIDQGNNTMPCDYGAPEGGSTMGQSGNWTLTATTPGIKSPNCVAINSGDTVGTLVVPGTSNQEGYDAGAGYDLATGLGSLNVANVVDAWPAIAPAGGATASVTVTPGAGSVNSNATLTVTVAVGGQSGQPAPTGAVTLASNNGGYTSTQALNTSASASFTIPVNTFTASGSVTLTATYSGDGVYGAASGTGTVTVNYIPPPTFSIGTISNPAGIAPGATGTANVSVSTANGYAGTVTLSCALTAAPSGANSGSYPTCTANGTVALSAGATSGSTTLTVTTTKTTAALTYPKVGSGKGWMGGGAVLALLVFFGIPARRRSWRAMLGMVFLLVTLGSLAACGGGGTATPSGSGTGSTGTTAGQYTFTVTGTGNPAVKPSPSGQTFTVTVN